MQSPTGPHAAQGGRDVMGLYRETTWWTVWPRPPESRSVQGKQPLPDVAGEHFVGRAPSTRVDRTPLRKDGMNDEREAGGTGEGAEDERLLALLRELVGKEGQPEAAELLGVSARTLRRTMGSGRLSPRVRDALELQRLSEGGESPARAAGDTGELARRVDRLESRVDTLAEELKGSLDKMRSTSETRPAVAKTRPAEGTAVKPPRRPYPQLVTLEPEVGEELLYGEAMPAIIKWRQARRAYEASKRRLDKVEAALRLRELEIVIVGDHELTLPPAVYPWNRSDRRDEVWRRGEWLEDLRVERNRALVLRWIRRVLTLGLWWK